MSALLGPLRGSHDALAHPRPETESGLLGGDDGAVVLGLGEPDGDDLAMRVVGRGTAGAGVHALRIAPTESLDNHDFSAYGKSMTSTPSYDEVTAWLREAHKINVTSGQRPSWSCSCGAGSKPVSMYTTEARVRAARDRHLQAQRRKFDREYVADQQAYLEHLRRNGGVEDAKDMSR